MTQLVSTLQFSCFHVGYCEDDRAKNSQRRISPSKRPLVKILNNNNKNHFIIFHTLRPLFCLTSSHELCRLPVKNTSWLPIGGLDISHRFNACRDVNFTRSRAQFDRGHHSELSPLVCPPCRLLGGSSSRLDQGRAPAWGSTWPWS